MTLNESVYGEEAPGLPGHLATANERYVFVA
jgi:hypothetical protein